MNQYWGKWSMLKKKPDLKDLTLEDTEIHYLGYKVVIVDYYDKGRWDLTNSEVRCITEYDKEEWDAIQKGKNYILRLRDNEEDQS